MRQHMYIFTLGIHIWGKSIVIGPAYQTFVHRCVHYLSTNCTLKHHSDHLPFFRVFRVQQVMTCDLCVTVTDISLSLVGSGKVSFNSLCSHSTRQPKAFPLRVAWAWLLFLLRMGRSRLKIVSWSLSSSDSDIIRLELCSVLRCLIPNRQVRGMTTRP